MSTKTYELDASMVLAVLIMPFLMLLILPISLWFGWAASVLWGWFVTPVFGLPQITITQAAGISLILALLRAKLASPKDETSLSVKALVIIVAPPLSVAMGWILKWLAF